MYIAISAAGAFRTDDHGGTWQPINKGLRSGFMPDPTAVATLGALLGLAGLPW